MIAVEVDSAALLSTMMLFCVYLCALLLLVCVCVHEIYVFLRQVFPPIVDLASAPCFFAFMSMACAKSLEHD